MIKFERKVLPRYQGNTVRLNVPVPIQEHLEIGTGDSVKWIPTENGVLIRKVENNEA